MTAVIDSYCEAILEEGQFCVVQPAPREAKEELLANLRNELMRFADETKYTPEDFQTGRALLVILKKIFGSKDYLQGVRLSEDVQAYYDETMRMLDHAIEQLPVFSAETTFTIVSNLLLLTNNLAGRSTERKAKLQKAESVGFTTTDRNYDVAFAYLDAVMKIKAKGVRAEKRIARKKRAEMKSGGFRMHMKRATKILVTGLLTVAAIGMLIAYIVGQNDVIEQTVRPEATNIFSAIGNWVNYDVFGAKMPVVRSDGMLKKAMPYTLVGCIAAVVMLAVLWLVKPIYKQMTAKQEQLNNMVDEQAKRTWYEFQYLHKILIATNMRLQELEE